MLTPEKYKKLVQQLEKHLPQEEEVEFKKEQVLFYEGHLPCGVFVLLKGQTSPPAKDKFLGLTELLADKPYSETVTATTDVCVALISKSEVFSFL